MWKKLQDTYENLLLLLKYGSLVLGACGAIYCYIDDKTNKKIKISYDTIVTAQDERFRPLEEVVSDFIVLSIKKVYFDLKRNPTSVKKLEIEHLMTYWEYLPEKHKNVILRKQYEFIYEWYLQNR